MFRIKILRNAYSSGRRFVELCYGLVSVGVNHTLQCNLAGSGVMPRLHQSCYCPSANVVTLVNMGKCFTRTQRIVNVTKQKQSTTKPFAIYVHGDAIKWKHFLCYRPFVPGILHQLPVNSPHEGRWLKALMFSLISAWTNGWVNSGDASDLRRHLVHYDVTVMCYLMNHFTDIFIRAALVARRNIDQ